MSRSFLLTFLFSWIFSSKNLSYSRAYIDFKKPEDVIEFAEFFDGHVFVNEKGNYLDFLMRLIRYIYFYCRSFHLDNGI